MTARSLSRSLGAALVVATCSAAAAEPADVVLQWNEIAQNAVAPTNPYIQSRSMAITQLAILNAITDATITKDAGPPVSPDAAVIAAARDVLSSLHPDAAGAVEAAA